MRDRKLNNYSNEEIFINIYSEYFTNVYRKIKKMLYSKVDDDITSCTQKTFEIAWNKVEIIKEHSNVVGCL